MTVPRVNLSDGTDSLSRLFFFFFYTQPSSCSSIDSSLKELPAQPRLLIIFVSTLIQIGIKQTNLEALRLCLCRTFLSASSSSLDPVSTNNLSHSQPCANFSFLIQNSSLVWLFNELTISANALH